MQTSKIKIGAEYAVKYKGNLARFLVHTIDTHRTARVTFNKIGGQIMDVAPDGQARPEVKYAPEDILGDYTEYAELVEEKNRKRKEREDEAAAKENEMYDLWRDLYKAAGVAVPNDPKSYRNALRLSWNDIYIGQSNGGVALMRKLLEKLKVDA
jgi:hypothetical protein